MHSKLVHDSEIYTMCDSTFNNLQKVSYLLQNLVIGVSWTIKRFKKHT